MYGQNTYLNSTPQVCLHGQLVISASRLISTRQRYRIGPIISNGAFHYALETSPYARDPK